MAGRSESKSSTPSASGTAVGSTSGIDVGTGLCRIAPSGVVLVAVLGAWQLFVTTTGVPEVILPSPLAVGRALSAELSTLLGDAAVTALTAGLGLLAGVVLGLVLAFAMVSSRGAAATIHPYLVALRIAPVIAIAPLLFLWFGRGIVVRALLVTTLTVFPVAIASLDGLRSVPREYLDAARSVGASSRRVFVFVRMPAAAPSVLAGTKLAAALSVIGTVVAEFVALRAGLGYRVVVTSTNLETAETFAALVVLSLVGLAFYSVPATAERRWRRHRRGRGRGTRDRKPSR